MAALRKGTSLFRHVTSEPALFVYTFVIIFYDSMFASFLQQKICSPDKRPSLDFVCTDATLLAEAADLVTIRSTLRNALPAIIVLFAGAWRDATLLNKPVMYVALFWEILGVCIQVYSYLNWSSSPWSTSIFEGIINGLGGGTSLFFVGALCVVTESAQHEDRTLRLTIVFAEMSIGGSIALGLTGYCQVYMGYFWMLIFSICLHLLTLLLVIVFIKDDKPKKGENMWKILKQLKTATKSRPNSAVIWLMVTSSSIVIVQSIGEGNLYQYYLQQGFYYSIKEVGIYSCYRMIVGSVGAILFPPILTNVLKWSDFKIGIVCSLVTIVSCLSMVFAKTNLEIKLLVLLDLLKLILFGLPKSIISKCVNDDEIGVFLSICSIGESILPIGIFYLYDYIYKMTYRTLPGAFYLASVATFVISFICYSISACIYIPSEAGHEHKKGFPCIQDDESQQAKESNPVSIVN